MTLSRTVFARLLTVVVMFVGLIISPSAAAQWPRAYDPACGPADEGCHAWSELRRTRPYPYQDIAIRTTGTGNRIVIVTEPPPRLAETDIEGFVADLFGDSFRGAERRRWQIGVDGWLEDLIVTLTPESDDDRFEDQLAFLYLTVFDTTFGGDFLVLNERTTAPLPIEQSNLAVSAADIIGGYRNPLCVCTRSQCRPRDRLRGAPS